MRRRWITAATVTWGLVLTGVLVVTADPAVAAPAPAAPPRKRPLTEAQKNKAAGLEHLRAGVALYNAGEYEKAIVRYQKAFALYPNPKIYPNIGSCYKYMGQPLKAIRYFELFLAKTEMDSVDPVLVRLRRLSRLEIKQLSRRIARLRVRVKVRDAVVKIAGQPFLRSPVDKRLRLMPGRISILITKRGYYPQHRTVTLKANESQTIRVLMLRKIERKIVIKVKPATPIYKRWWFWTVVGALVVGGATAAGIVLGSRTVDKRLSGDFRLDPSSFGVRF